MRSLQGSHLEIAVLEGPEAGRRFALARGAEVEIGRGAGMQVGAILLSDPSLAPRQAVVRNGQGGPSLEHRREAATPTRLNGTPVRRRRLAVGDHIQVGRTVLELREPATSVSDDPIEPAAPESAEQEAQLAPLPPDQTTEIRPSLAPGRYLTLIRGLPSARQERFFLRSRITTIGRSPSCDVEVPERGVSRLHAELQWEGHQLLLVPRSRSNATLLNGVAVIGHEAVSDGDEIQLADRVVLRLDREPGAQPLVAGGTLRERLEDKLRQEGGIERDFRVEGAFLDVDVVDSYRMKSATSRGDHVVLSFERYRDFVATLIEASGGEVLNCNGDEFMCLFGSPEDAVRAALELLGRLPAFNAVENLLEMPFRVRVGVHSGSSLVDRSRGVAYSEVLDIAGHLQKAAAANGLMVSEAVRATLPGLDAFEPAGDLPKGGTRIFRWTGPIEGGE